MDRLFRLTPAWLLIVSLFFLGCQAGDEDVLDLSDNSVDSFKSELAKHDTILVEFFAPWCGHCKRLAPEYAKAATALKSNDPPVPLAKVDCTNEAGGKEICNDQGVQGFPTLKIFKGGDLASEYNGPRDADGIVKYMRGQVGPASKQYNEIPTLNEALGKSKDVLVLGVFPSESDSLYSKFQKAADRLRESVNFAHVLTESASGSLSDLAALKSVEVSEPSIVLVRPSVLSNKFEEPAVVYSGDGSLDEFVTKNYHGLVGHRTQSNMGDFKPPVVIAYYDVDYVKNPKGTNYWRNRVLKVAKNFKDSDVTFAVSNAQQFAGELDEYGISPSSERDAPPSVAARDKEGRKYVMSEKFTVESFEKFVKDFLDGKLEPHVKSEEIPEGNDEADVKVAVAKNFDELVVKSAKDILIEFYAPWCGHCKRLAPTWEELGKALKDEPSVEIVKMDATANDVPPPFVVHGFPTIYWYPADSKEPKKYEGGRDVNDFISYISKHSSQDLVGYDRSGQPKAGKEEL